MNALLVKSSLPRRYSRGNFKRPPFSKAVSLDYDDRSYHTFSSSSSKQTTIRIENLTEDEAPGDDDTDIDDEDSSDLMMSANEYNNADFQRNRFRTVSTVSECSEFSTCH